MKLSGANQNSTVKAITKTSRAKTASTAVPSSKPLTIGERVALMRKHGVGSIQITVAKTIGELKIGRIYPEAVESE